MALGLYHVLLYAARDKSKDWICKDCGKYCEYPNNVGVSPFSHLICPNCNSENIVVNREMQKKEIKSNA